MLSSPYPILKDWAEYSPSRQREIIHEMFLKDIIMGDTPEDAVITWNNTTDSDLIRGQEAIKSDKFTDTWGDVDFVESGHTTVRVRAHNEFIDCETDNTLLAKRLVYTANISIQRDEVNIDAELSTIPVDTDAQEL